MKPGSGAGRAGHECWRSPQTADLSRRRSRVRAPSSPPFLFNVFPDFSIACREMPSDGSRHRSTPTDRKCPQYSEQTVAATVALGDRHPGDQIRRSGRHIRGAFRQVWKGPQFSEFPAGSQILTRHHHGGPTDANVPQKGGKRPVSPETRRLLKASSLSGKESPSALCRAHNKGAEILGISLALILFAAKL